MSKILKEFYRKKDIHNYRFNNKIRRFYISDYYPDVIWNRIKHKFCSWIYGFDVRDTWELDIRMTELLYERLVLYKKIAFKFVDLESDKIKIKGNEYTQLETIDMLISLCEEFLALDELEYANINFGLRESQRLTNEIWDLWKIIAPKMWC